VAGCGSAIWLRGGVAMVVLSAVVDAAPTPAQVEFFEQRIRPILAGECYECHGAEKQEGGLRLDSREAVREGGDSGPALVVGNPGDSRLIQSLVHSDVDSRMPKDRLPLPAGVIADFKRWIDEGAADPRDAPPAAGDPRDWQSVFRLRSDWWSFKPLTKPAPPDGPDRHPVDRFLNVKMADHGLSPAATADRAVLLRRVSFVLTGLPPTPEETQAFLADEAAGAFERVVDRLLASPRFGERWARHWMDLTRFAETHGSEGDPEIPHAWRYRDYLIRALNADVPWDLLIREHVAGDLLDRPRIDPEQGVNESMIGPANLRLVEHGFQPIDTLDEQVKTVDNQIDVISKAFQGLTISCARCHDHKFDPISQRDYFALYGVLASSRPGHVAIDLPERLRVNRGELERLKSLIQGSLAEAWMRSTGELHRHMTGAEDGRSLVAAGDELAEKIAAATLRIAEMERAIRATALARRAGLDGSPPVADPLAVWTFDQDAGDSRGGLHGELQGGAVVRDGRLILDGKGSFLRTPPLAAGLTEKTLEAWVTVADREQRGGGVFTVESGDGAAFDSIVFAEGSPRRWIAGSEFAVRSRDTGGAEEAAAADALVHLAIVYRADHRIEIYRNGEPYGAAYTPAGDAAKLRTFDAGSARVLLGMRHTGGGSPFFHGEIEEARLYDRALAAEEIATSFQSGPGEVSAEELVAAMTPEQRAIRERDSAAILADSAELAARFPDHARHAATRQRQLAAFQAALDDPAHPLHRWKHLREAAQAAPVAPVADPNPADFTTFWEAGSQTAEPWFAIGINPPVTLERPGGFTIEPEGDAVLGGLLPTGVYSHLLSSKHHGMFSSPRFKITSGAISVLVVGGNGARVRLIPDHYPIGGDRIFPQATLNSPEPTWVRLDTEYRKGTMAHLEFVTADDSLSRERARTGPDGRSFFGVSRVVFHEGAGPSRAVAGIGVTAETADGFAEELRRELQTAISAWMDDTLNGEQHALLDAFVRGGLLPTSLADLADLAPLVAEYRKLEAEIPEPRRAPGVYETEAVDVRLMERGDHLKPAELVPRGYLELISNKPYATRQSGRLELATDLTGADNPLTSRVMVNRLWHHLFGRGLVGTVDNFGRLGDAPTHPELLDHLAARFQENGWSAKEMIRFLVTSEAWQRSSEASPEAREIDPENRWLSHARVRRLEGEAVRDSLLAISGRLDPEMYGPGADALAPPPAQRRRSVYLTIRRNHLSPFLEIFDAPRPFTTLGKRDATNVPGQSLALLNDPFVIEQAGRWAETLLENPATDDERVARMFLQALGRTPAAREMAMTRAYLADLSREHGEDGRQLVWQDLAQSVFNFKEFIYLR
jgi:hypothetical protein